MVPILQALIKLYFYTELASDINLFYLTFTSVVLFRFPIKYDYGQEFISNTHFHHNFNAHDGVAKCRVIQIFNVSEQTATEYQLHLIVLRL